MVDKNNLLLHYELCMSTLYNSKSPSEPIAEGYSDKNSDIKNINTFDIKKQLSQNDKKR